MTLASELQSKLQREAILCVCGAPLECFYGKNGRRWNVHHPLHPGDCQFRFETFGYGPTEEEAWAAARRAIEATKL